MHQPWPWLKKQVGEVTGVATWNVGSVTGRSREMAEVMRKRRVAILCVQETWWRRTVAWHLDNECKLLYNSVEQGRNGVGTVLHGEWRKKMIDVNRVNGRLMSVKVTRSKKLFNVVLAYAP